jgi:hypothetical protein
MKKMIGIPIGAFIGTCIGYMVTSPPNYFSYGFILLCIFIWLFANVTIKLQIRK